MARALTEDESRLIAQLRGQIGRLHRRNSIRTRYADGEQILSGAMASVPSIMQSLAVPVGWPRRTLAAFSARMVPQFYSLRTASTLLDDVEAVFADNDLEFIESQAIDAAALHGCSFVFTSAGDPELGEPEVLVTVRDARSASAILDPRTRAVRAALEMVDENTAILHLPGTVLRLERGYGAWQVVDTLATNSSRVLCTPYVHGATLHRPLGASRITKPLMGLTDLGVRTLLRQEVASEYYAAPRGFLVDVNEDQFDVDPTSRHRTGWESTIGIFNALASQIDDQDNIVEPKIQFAPQMTMQPFSDQLRLIAGMVSGETSIPLQDLGVVQDSNPTSAEAIHASEVALIREVRGQYPSFNLGRRSLALDILTAIHGDLDAAALADLRSLTPRWEDPRTRSVSEQSQFVALQVQAGNFQAGTEATLSQLPLDPVDVARIAVENRSGVATKLVDALVGATKPSPDALQLATSESASPGHGVQGPSSARA